MSTVPGSAEWPLVDAEGMRRRDRHTIERLGVPGELLMESAGRAVAAAALSMGARRRGVLVVCGRGNNGGDGLVAARHLHLLGAAVAVVLVGGGEDLGGDAATNLERARAAGVPFGEPAARSGRVIVDAIFGTGLTRAVEGEAAAAVEHIRRARREDGCRVLAVDLPSGLSADTGQPLGVCVEADVTVTLGLPKLGLALEPGRSLAGRVLVARIGIADEVPGAPLAPSLWTRAGAGARLPARPAAAHKGSFGHVLVIAGSEGKTGAAALAAEGAGRAGAGLVTLACPASLNDILETKCTEVMTVPVPETSGRGLAPAAEKPLLELAAARDVVALGPGIGTDAQTVALVRALVPALERPLVLDADGLNAIAADPSLLKARGHPTIVTPHPGEAGRLLGLRGQEINADRVGYGACALRADRCGGGAERGGDRDGRAGRTRDRESDRRTAARDRRHRRRAHRPDRGLPGAGRGAAGGGGARRLRAWLRGRPAGRRTRRGRGAGG